MEKESSNTLRIVLKKHINTAKGILQSNCKPYFKGIQLLENCSEQAFG